MDTLTIRKLDESFVHIECEDTGIHHEIWEFFSFKMENAQWHPKVKRGVWDGVIRLYDRRKHILPFGLIPRLINFCDSRQYDYNIEDSIFPDEEYPADYPLKLAEKLQTPFTPHDYQVTSVLEALNNNRGIILSPTGSGKSFIIYLLMAHYAMRKKKVLLVVPSISLVSQMTSDFEEYANGKDLGIYQIKGGIEKSNKNQLTVSTWQSIYKQSKNWFAAFDAVIVDEAHEAEATSIKTLVEKCVNAQFKIATTGTLKDAKTHQLTLEGIFGPVIKATTTLELMERKILAQLKISCVVLNHSTENRKLVGTKKRTYEKEIDFVVTNESRNKFIANLAHSLKGNTLVLFNFVDKQGKPLYKMIKDVGKKPAYYISGEVDGDDRESIRKLVDNPDGNNIIVASYGTFSRGINIKNLHNLVFASPMKGKIRTLQSIGRSLRVDVTKFDAGLFDISDDLTYQGRENYGLKHLKERVDIYEQEGFEFTLHSVKLRS